jgi:esterase/lipase superfamily enzyme
MRRLLASALLFVVALPGHAGSTGVRVPEVAPAARTVAWSGTATLPHEQGESLSHSNDPPATDSVWVFTNRARQDGRWRTMRGEVRRLVRAFRVAPIRRDPVPYEVRMQVQRAGEQWLDTAAMRTAVSSALAQQPAAALVLHVHGYATSLDEATEEAAEMRRRGGFGGPMAVFAWPARNIGVTWPAAGKVFTSAYWQDSLLAQQSVDDFVDVLHEVIAMAGADRVVVSAHSMGNQLLATALQRPHVQAALQRTPLRAIVFASPDVDHDWFHGTVVPAARPLAERLVLYGARDDHMLRISSLVHGGAPRAGLLDEDNWPDTPGLEVVDITDGRVAAPWFGSLFDTNHALRRHGTALADLFGHVAADAPASARCEIGVVPVESPDEVRQTSAGPSAAPAATNAAVRQWRAVSRRAPGALCAGVDEPSLSAAR